MSPGLHGFLVVDAVPLAVCVLSVVACAVLGNFLVLRRESLLGDAISHAVLPGLVVAFLVTQSRSPAPMFVGAGAAAGLTVVLTMLVRRLGGVEPGAAMGVVFSVMFALGVYLIESGSLRDIDLDASCVLYGQVEYHAWWRAPREAWAYARPATYLETDLSPALPAALAVCALSIGFVVVFFKELRLTAFDPQMARAAGFPAWLVQGALVLLVALAVVASFQAVGSILVIAMVIVPAAAARLLTDRLGVQVVLSGVVAAGCAGGGYFGGTRLPGALWAGESLNAAGSITVAAGLVFLGACLFAPEHGAVARAVRARRLAARIAVEDLLGLMYRSAESGAGAVSLSPARASGLPVARAERLGLVVRLGAGGLGLTSEGRTRAEEIIRRHRLWEGYLVERAGLRPDHVHATAEVLEHLDQPGAMPRATSGTDPHGRAIPPGPG